MNRPCALVMAGGTGGHIFPGLAVAQALRDKGWRVHWLGTPNSMETRLVPLRGFPMELVDFSGVRGKGVMTWVRLPWRLLRACFQSFQVLQRVRPDVVLGFGGYISLPAGLVTVLRRIPLVLHEQNAIAGMANQVLSKVAARIFTAFPNVMKKAQWVGNPLRGEFLNQAEASERFSGRTGPMKVLVIGGSLGARALNAVVPLALAKIPLADRPRVMHQSGDKEIDTLRTNYFDANVEATLTPFIDNTAQAFADADIVICRAGASTVTEIAAIGAAALFVPFPGAVDDHQTHNAQFLTKQGAGWTIQQSELTPAYLAAWLQSLNRDVLKDCAEKAKTLACLNATQAIAQACEELAQ